MSQRDFYRQISEATGEPVSVIENLGFVELRRIAFERERPSAFSDDLDSEFEADLAMRDGRELAAA